MPEAPRRRPVALTPLIDVIFLLLLFFMLTTTFTRTGEIPLTAAGAGGDGLPSLFLRVEDDGLTLNGIALTLDDLPQALRESEDRRLLIALAEGLRAQRLADVLQTLRAVPGVRAQVLGG